MKNLSLVWFLSELIREDMKNAVSKSGSIIKIRTFRQLAKSSDYLGLVGEGGFEPPKHDATDLQSIPKFKSKLP